MPEPPQLVPLDAEEQQFNSRLLLDDRTSHSMKETYVGRLYLILLVMTQSS